MFKAYISIYNEYRYIQNIDKYYTKYRIDKNWISMTVLVPIQDEKPNTYSVFVRAAGPHGFTQITRNTYA